jgi:hypothetical protein
MERMMETFVAIVIAAVVVPIVLLLFIMVPVLIWLTMSFLSQRQASDGPIQGTSARSVWPSV